MLLCSAATKTMQSRCEWVEVIAAAAVVEYRKLILGTKWALVLMQSPKNQNVCIHPSTYVSESENAKCSPAAATRTTCCCAAVSLVDGWIIVGVRTYKSSRSSGVLYFVFHPFLAFPALWHGRQPADGDV